jgi:HD-like signal output (HDOD) protein
MNIGVDSAVASGITQEILDSIKIPTLPEAAAHLLELCRDEYVSCNEIVRVVELDSALSARLLKLANSSYFGQQYCVSTLTRAAVVLGNEHLKAAALGFYLSSGWRHLGHSSFDLREFWRDNILRACLARQLAWAMEMHPTEQAFLVGMLGDIGSLILSTHFKERYVPLWEQGRGDFLQRRVMERAELGTDHVEVAKALACRWKFPEALASALGRRCLEPPMTRGEIPPTVLWQLSYFLAAVPFAMDRQTARLAASLRHLAISAFGLSFEALSNVFTAAVEQFNILRNVFLDLSPADCDTESLMSEAAKLMQGLDPEVNEQILE